MKKQSNVRSSIQVVLSYKYRPLEPSLYTPSRRMGARKDKKDIKMKKCFPLPYVFCLFLLFCTFASSRSEDIPILVLHEKLGEVIDSRENAQYNVFGDIEGFTAARFYSRNVRDFYIHVIRNIENRAHILIVDVPLERSITLRNSIKRRIDITQQKDVQFDEPLFPIEESRWAEKSANKKIVLRDGSQLMCTMVQAQGDTLILRTLGGLEIPVPDILIANVSDLRVEIVEGPFQRIDPNTSRLFFAPTGRRLQKGNGYFADYYVFFPTLAYGLTDFFSMSGGVSLLPGAESQLLYFAPKLTFQLSPQVGLGTGFLYLAIPDEDDLNLGYAVTTIGTNQAGLTLGAGIPLSDSDKDLLLLLGGEIQVSNSAKLITENWIFTGEDANLVFSAGIRFFGERLAVDLALITFDEAFEGDGFPLIPWVDFSVFFGK